MVTQWCLVFTSCSVCLGQTQARYLQRWLRSTTTFECHRYGLHKATRSAIVNRSLGLVFDYNMLNVGASCVVLCRVVLCSGALCVCSQLKGLQCLCHIARQRAQQQPPQQLRPMPALPAASIHVMKVS